MVPRPMPIRRIWVPSRDAWILIASSILVHVRGRVMLRSFAGGWNNISVKYHTNLRIPQHWWVDRVLNFSGCVRTVTLCSPPKASSPRNRLVITMRPSLIPKLRPSSLISCTPNQSARHFSILIIHTSRRATSTAQHQLSQPLSRHFISTTAKSTTMAGNPEPQFSANTDAATLEIFLSPLLVTNGGRWSLTMEGQALEREFKFKTFAKTWVS